MNSQYTNTRDAHRLMKLAEKRYDRNTVEKLNKALFAAYFTENLELADHKVLFEKAVQSGMKADEVKEVLDTDKYVEEVILDEREAVMRGIRGVPYIVFNGSFAVPGALTLDGFKSALQRELRKQQNDAINQKGHVCGPDGCKI